MEQISFNALGTFSTTSSQYLETALLRVVALRDRPLWLNSHSADERLPRYTASVRNLRESIERQDPLGTAALSEVLQKLGTWYHDIEVLPQLHTNPSMTGYGL